MMPPGMRASPSSLPIQGRTRPGKASCQRISIIRQKPKKRNTRPVTAYCMPITLWSTEKTYFRQNDSSGCCSGWAWGSWLATSMGVSSYLLGRAAGRGR